MEHHDKPKNVLRRTQEGGWKNSMVFLGFELRPPSCTGENYLYLFIKEGKMPNMLFSRISNKRYGLCVFTIFLLICVQGGEYWIAYLTGDCDGKITTPLLIDSLYLIYTLLVVVFFIAFFRIFSSRPYPMILHFLNINAIFVGGILLPFYGNSIVLKIGGVLLTIHFLFIIVFKNILVKVSDILFKTSFAKEISLAMTVVIISIGGSEYFALVATKYQILSYSVPMTTMLPQGTEDWRLAHITADAYREADPVFWWRPINRYPYNSQRFKGKEVSIEKKANIFRIICYGDSNTDGPDRGNWPEQLQSILDKTAHSKQQMIYEVLNAGVAGYSSHQGFLRFKQDMRKFKPDIVLVSFGWNDLADAIGKPDKLFTPPPPMVVAIQRFLLHFRFYLCLKYYVTQLHAQQQFSLSQRVSLEDYLENMGKFFLLAKENHINIVFLTRPHQKSVSELEHTSNWRKLVPSYNRSLLEFGKQNDVLVIDVQKTFETIPELFGDECHFTIEGHQKMAKIIYQSLVHNRLLP